MSDTELAHLLSQVSTVISSRLRKYDPETGEQKEKSNPETVKESVKSKLDRALTSPQENDFPTGDSEPQLHLTRRQLDRELDEMVAERESVLLSSKVKQLRIFD